MSNRLPQLKPKEFIRALQKLGFVLRRQTGSHAIFRHPTTNYIAVIPIHTKDIKRSLLFGILKQTHVSVKELQKALR